MIDVIEIDSAQDLPHRSDCDSDRFELRHFDSTHAKIKDEVASK